MVIQGGGSDFCFDAIDTDYPTTTIAQGGGIYSTPIERHSQVNLQSEISHPNKASSIHKATLKTTDNVGITNSATETAKPFNRNVKSTIKTSLRYECRHKFRVVNTLKKSGICTKLWQ